VVRIGNHVNNLSITGLSTRSAKDRDCCRKARLPQARHERIRIKVFMRDHQKSLEPSLPLYDLIRTTFVMTLSTNPLTTNTDDDAWSLITRPACPRPNADVLARFSTCRPFITICCLNSSRLLYPKLPIVLRIVFDRIFVRVSAYRLRGEAGLTRYTYYPQQHCLVAAIVIESIYFYTQAIGTLYTPAALESFQLHFSYSS
jgi:hypothetical protein